MTTPLKFSFEVGCGVDHAFAIWTEKIASWWPDDHTLSGAPAAIVLEGRAGGRIYERFADGREVDWGRVTAWQPPTLLGYRWHLGMGPESATDVEVTFSVLNPGRTRIEIAQSGWERLGASASELRTRNQVGWTSLESHFRTAAEA